MVPKLIGTKELENKQYIGQTPLYNMHRESCTSQAIGLNGVYPIYRIQEIKEANIKMINNIYHIYEYLLLTRGTWNNFTEVESKKEHNHLYNNKHKHVTNDKN